jgi:hypothetical protein
MKRLGLFLFIILLISTIVVKAQETKELPSNLPSPDQATFAISVDDVPLGDNFEIIGFIIEDYVNGSKFAQIEFHFNGDIDKLRILNREIQITLGYHFTHDLVFKGESIMYSLREIPHLPPLFTMECADEATQNRPKPIGDAPAIALTRASNILESDLSINAFKEVHGMVRIAGTNSVVPGDMISLEGFTPDINGTHKISKLIHEFRENKWHTIIIIGHEP